MIELHDANGALIDSNDDWRTNQAVILSTGLAPTNDAESALLLPNPAAWSVYRDFARQEQWNGCWGSRGLRFPIKRRRVTIRCFPFARQGNHGAGVSRLRAQSLLRSTCARSCNASRWQPLATSHLAGPAQRFPSCLTKTIISGI